MVEFFRVGVISSIHGIHGEVKVFPTTDAPERFKKQRDLFILLGQDYVPIKIESMKFFKNMLIMKFQGMDSIEAITPYKGKELYVDRAHATPLKKGEYYIADLIGLKVVDEDDKALGELTDVLQTAANDVYVCKMEDGKELLLPSIPDCILERNLEEGFVRVHVMPGLMDL